MIPAQRRALVLDLIRQDGAASIVQLARRIDASLSTIRRDLDYLTEQGYLERSHGGAVLKSSEHTTFDPDHEIGSRVAHDAKVAIGAQAAAMVEPGQSVIFDSSSTVFEAARFVAERDVIITAVTNDLGIGNALAHSPNIRLVVPGGTLRPRSLTLIGEPGQGFLEGLSVDLAFLGINALAKLRLSEAMVDVAILKRQMIKSARRTIVLADANKFAHSAFCEVCALRDTQLLITDTRISDADIRALEGEGVDVEIVKPADGQRGDCRPATGQPRLVKV